MEGFIGCIRNLNSFQYSIPVNFSFITSKIRINCSLIEVEITTCFLGNNHRLFDIAILANTSLCLKINILTRQHCRIACLIILCLNIVTEPTIWDNTRMSTQINMGTLETSILNKISKGAHYHH